MLFNSFAFLLGYAPIVFIGFFLLGKYSSRWACAWLGMASLIFYAWWYPPHTLILLVSIIGNFFSGILIGRAGAPGSKESKEVLVVALALNLCALCYYKYFGFFGNIFMELVGVERNFGSILLPLGISFFTFTQIAYLVDTYQGKVKEHDFLRYLLFVTYFPHLVAGPIIHHHDVMSQFANRRVFRFNTENFAAGAVMFIIGLFKKVVIADNIAHFSNGVFAIAEQGQPLGAGQAWAGALAYALQLYFDFSGYSDMAIGLSLMLNVRLPFNFDSPYKSHNIVDFWRRWHISLSTFLRDYLYIPLGGNRHGKTRRYINMGVTMFLGGLWHGAGWTFIIWGILHGFYLAVNHAWRGATEDFQFVKSSWYGALSWAFTLFMVLIAWIFFRAHSVDGALHLLHNMSGFSDQPTAMQLPLADGTQVALPFVYVCLLPLLAITLWAPNSQEIVARLMVQSQHFVSIKGQFALQALEWRAVSWHAAWMLGLLLAAALLCMSQPTEFLYFNF